MTKGEFVERHRELFDKFMDAMSATGGDPEVFINDLTDRQVYILAHFMNLLQEMSMTAGLKLLEVAKA
jgi:hypothetical protein